MTENLATTKTPSQNQKRLAWIARVGIFAISYFVITVIFMVEREPSLRNYEFVVGQPAPRTLFSPFHLTYVNEKATQLLKNQKSQEVPPVFVLQPKVSKQIHARIERFFSLLYEAKQKKMKEKEIGKQKWPVQISEHSLELLLEGSNLEEARKDVEILLEKNLSQGFLEDRDKSKLLESKVNAILLMDPEAKTEKLFSLNELMPLREVKDSSARMAKEMIPKNDRLREAVLEIFDAVIVSNLTGDAEEEKNHRAKAAEAVTPVQEEIKKDELVVQRGMLITPQEKTRLDRIEKEMAKQKILSKLLGVSLLILLVYLLGFVYLLFFERKIMLSFRLLLLIHVVFILTTVLCKIAVVWPGSSAYLMPVSLASLLLTLLIHPRIGFFSSATMAVLVAPLTGFSPDLIVATLLVSSVAVFAALRVRKRIEFLKIGIMIGGCYFLVLFAFQIFQEYSIEEAFFLSLQGFASGVLITTPIAFLLLPLFETVFNLTTDITLLELSDLNHPLLKRMIVEAPGTYHHSLVVSTLAESACEAIGANALLARVGAYFHDIGKIAKAPFFTENQPSRAASKHEKLTPTMSCLLIMNHVKDGIELGRRHKLKERILQFIPEHQGTGVIYYFYKKALDQMRPGERIHVEDFRYPGPKPQSKETAVVLLSDSTEAASRSLKEPTPDSIRRLVRKIINDKFIDGQLDECNLTLLDLRKIQESFIHNLMAIFHTRVSYPVIPQAPDNPDLFEEEQFSKFRTEC